MGPGPNRLKEVKLLAVPPCRIMEASGSLGDRIMALDSLARRAKDGPMAALRNESGRSMTNHNGPATEEVLVRSAERVRELGEVLTPADTVEAILDLLPDAVWQPHPSAKFLEPACGDGNFLVEILARKLERVSHAVSNGKLRRCGARGLAFYGLQALSTIYAVDISEENVVGGVPGHELGARTRLVNVLCHWYETHAGTKPQAPKRLLNAAWWIVERNIIVGNMLPFHADGSPSQREDIQIVEYHWDDDAYAVTAKQITLGDALPESSTPAAQAALFEPTREHIEWIGEPLSLAKAPIPLPASNVRQPMNGNGRPGE